MSIGIASGLLLAPFRYFKVKLVGSLIYVAAEFFRNSPVLVQLFLVYFGVPMFFQLELSPFFAAILTLSMNTAAFSLIIFVSAMEAIDREQILAAESFGLRRRQILQKIIGPQAMITAIPMLVGIAINQLQVTSLISVIGFIDITKVGEILNQRTLKPFIVWPLIGLTYFALAQLISYLGAWLGKRLSHHLQYRSVVETA